MDIIPVIKMDLVNLESGSKVFIPDSTTPCSGSFGITTPSIQAESSGTIQHSGYQCLSSDFATHIHDLFSSKVLIIATKTSGTSKEFLMSAKKYGKSKNGMSSWWVYTKNGYRMNLAEAVLNKPADLNQCLAALAVRASGEMVELGAKEHAIIKSVNTIYVQ